MTPALLRNLGRVAFGILILAALFVSVRTPAVGWDMIACVRSLTSTAAIRKSSIAMRPPRWTLVPAATMTRWPRSRSRVIGAIGCAMRATRSLVDQLSYYEIPPCTRPVYSYEAGISPVMQ